MQHVAKRARNLALFGVNGKIDHQAMSAMIENLRNANIQSKLEAIDSIPKEQLIGTHDGSFHCDEALAVSMLKLTSSSVKAVIYCSAPQSCTTPGD